MHKVKLLYLKRIRELGHFSEGQLGDIFDLPFDQKKGFGFYGTEVQNTLVESTLVYSSVLIQKVFDPKSRSLVLRQQPTICEVQFQLDCFLGVLQAYVGGKRLQKLLSILGQLFDSRITVEDIYLNLGDLVRKLDKRNLHFRISGICIDNFRPNEGLSGKLTASVIEQKAAREILRAYGADVTDLSLEITAEEDTILWRLSSFGKFAVKAEEDLISTQVDLLQEIALGAQNA